MGLYGPDFDLLGLLCGVAMVGLITGVTLAGIIAAVVYLFAR
jgi:hypothetical protein